MNLTIGGWTLFIIVETIIISLALWIGMSVISSTKATIISLFIGLVLSAGTLWTFNWYYTNTATGTRAVKTQKSELLNGIERTVTVYDMEGDIIKTYEGKFDVTYDNDRILFDDEQGLRHIIYYPTGTVIVDEVGQ